jgi:hypothetical protein
VPPITLYIRRTINRYRISRGQPTVIGNAIIRVEEYEVHDSRDNARNLVEERIVVAWHKICHLSQKVRHMYAFFPNVSSRLRARWFVATHYIAQMVTGQGAFKERLHRLGMVEDPRYDGPLGGPKTPEHILYECAKYETSSDNTFGNVRSQREWHSPHS